MTRRVLVGIALALTVTPPAAGRPAGETSDSIAAVSVASRGGGLYEITGRFEVEASSSTAWAVLSNYEDIPRFVPSMKSSRVLKRDEEEVMLEQVSVGRALIFRRRMRVLLKVEETPAREIRFEDVSKRSFRVYRGSWTIAPGAAGSEVTYRLTAAGSFAAPGFVAKGAAKRLVQELLESVRREMEARAGSQRI